MHILLTRDAKKSGNWIAVLKQQGHRVSCVAITKTIPPADDYRSLDSALQQIQNFQAILLTSRTAVQILADRFKTPSPLVGEGGGEGKIDDKLFFAAGPATAKEIQKHWDVPVHFPKEDLGEGGLVALLEKEDLNGLKVLWPRSNLSEDRLVEFCASKGAAVTTVEAYQTVTDFSQQNNLKNILVENVDLVLFFSPSQVRACSELCTGNQTSHAVALGATTAEAMKACDINGHVLSNPTPEGLAKFLTQLF